ncbi:MAG TPA: cobalamin B12-binding domain-containing protein [Candidatus Izemoplasmatales bacterium]|nr:cobalamin B12-binding domain-containing protein [Bacillota bacterium]HRY78193.1 cobalamin B12-binding domain-containing protein [Candidatus Izemoplasmatales bacterium]
MKEIYDRFAGFLQEENKTGAILYALELLENGSIEIPALYEKVLGPLLNAMHCPENDETCIWREHVRTSIVRAVVEVAYPYVIKAKQSTGFVSASSKVLVVCPTEEYHEIGARMAADFFELAGFPTTFVGANTPEKDILSAVKNLQPHYVAISVTNYYNLFKAKTVIDSILTQDPSIEVLLGGSAFRDPRHVECVRGRRVDRFADIVALAKEAH